MLHHFSNSRQYYPNFNELCSAELLSSKFLIPCNPVQYLNAEYGPNGWKIPEKKNYKFYGTKFYERVSDAEFLKTRKYYRYDGAIDNSTTFEELNSVLDKKITWEEYYKLNLS